MIKWIVADNNPIKILYDLYPDIISFDPNSEPRFSITGTDFNLVIALSIHNVGNGSEFKKSIRFTKERYSIKMDAFSDVMKELPDDIVEKFLYHLDLFD
jgi:hypothetical protein